MNSINLSAITNSSCDELIGIAVARGCKHYKYYVPGALAVDRPSIPHEMLGCALLRGPADLDTFHAIRVGAMVLSDAGNSPGAIGAAAVAFGVEGRVAHIAKLALKVGDQPDFWQAVLAGLPPADDAFEAGFLPGISRFRSECPITGPGRGPSLVWLRTAYGRASSK